MPTTITKDLCRTLASEIQTALDVIAAKHGLKVQIRGGTFVSSSFKPRIEFQVPGELGTSKTDEDSFRNYAKLYGLDPDMLGKVFTYAGSDYKVVGLSTGRSKNCVKIIRMRDGSPRVCPADMVKGGKFH